MSSRHYFVATGTYALKYSEEKGNANILSSPFFLEITLLYELPVFTHLNVSLVRQVAFLFCMKCVEGFGPKISVRCQIL